MIYWFTGQPGAGKTTLGKKLHSFLKTEKRNKMKNLICKIVFYLTFKKICFGRCKGLRNNG